MNTTRSSRSGAVQRQGGQRLLACAALGLTLGAATAPAQTVVTKPQVQKPVNILLIAVDDVGFSDLGCFGSEIHTPNIDSLARGGLRYTNSHTKAICSHATA